MCLAMYCGRESLNHTYLLLAAFCLQSFIATNEGFDTVGCQHYYDGLLCSF